MTNYAKQARANGWERYTVDMRDTRNDRVTTKNCFYEHGSEQICWEETLAVAYQDDDYQDFCRTEAGTIFEILDMQYGHSVLKPANTLDRYEYINETSDTNVKFRSNREYLQYHCFNQNGALAKYREASETLTQYVEADLINSGWLLSYSNDYHWEQMMHYVSKERVRPHNAYYHVEALQEMREELFTKIAQVHLNEIDRAGRPVTEDTREMQAQRAIARNEFYQEK